MKILITGGAGYIGSHVVKEFLDRRYRVTVYDNLSSGLKENLFNEAEFIQGDILDYHTLTEAMKKSSNAPFDAIVHLAALKAAGESMEKPEIYSSNNICGTINILNAASFSGIKKIVFSSSASVYGQPEYLPVDEQHKLNPQNFYGFTKMEIERLLFWYEKLKGIRYACLRYFNAAGYDKNGSIKGLEQNPLNLIPLIMETACGIRQEIQIYGNDYNTPDGTCIRDYVHVSDLAAAHAAALDYISSGDKSLTVNLGSEKGVSVLEMIEAVRRIIGKPIPAKITGRRAGDPAILTASSSLAQKLLGWETKHSDIETIIKTSWEAYKGLVGSE